MAMRKSSYDSMAFILDLTGCGSRAAQQIHHYTLLCSWLYQIFLPMFFHCHPGYEALLTDPWVPFQHLQGDLWETIWSSGWISWRARDKTSKQASEQRTNMGGGGFSTHRIRRGFGLKSRSMSVANVPMMCLGNRLCRGKL